MLLSTTHVLDGHHVSSYLGVVSSEAVLGANLFRDFFAGMRDIFGGRSRAYEEVLARGKEMVMNELAAEAHAKGANGVIGIDLAFSTIGRSMLMVSASGTAVKTTPR